MNLSNSNRDHQPDEPDYHGPEHPGYSGSGMGREPVFNLPSVIVWLAAFMFVVHLVREYLLQPEQNVWTIYAFSFIPARYSDIATQLPIEMAAWWSPVTYAFLHGGWAHLFMNLLWMAAFGTPLARRVGTARFLILSVIAALGGALLHLMFHIGDLVPVIGASAVVSGHMGAAARFAFQGGRRGMITADGPALTLAQSFTNRVFLTFMGVWMAINLVFGSGAIPIAGADQPIAWQAHIGGFLAGLFFFSLFDRIKPQSNLI
ncbi:MAG: rhomboid family intramembrane serine protease [Pseudomonadota bacterium]